MSIILTIILFPNGTVVIFHGLRQPEAYLQVCDALDNLNHVVDEVFSRITSRVFNEKSKLEALSSRLGVAHVCS